MSSRTRIDLSPNPPQRTISQLLELSLGVEHWQAALFSGILCKKQAGKKKTSLFAKEELIATMTEDKLEHRHTYFE